LQKTRAYLSPSILLYSKEQSSPNKAARAQDEHEREREQQSEPAIIMLFTRRLVGSLLLATRAPLQRAGAEEPQLLPSEEPKPLPTVFSRTFTERAIGMELSETSTGQTQVLRVVEGSAAWNLGVPPLSVIVGINGNDVSTLRYSDLQPIIKKAPRPLELTFDGSAYAGLRPDEIVKKAAQAQGMEAATLKIEKTAANQGLRCSMLTRAADTVEFEYEASYATATGSTMFDSSAQRSGRPFAMALGNGDAQTRGLELGLLEMCIGEERTLRVPPELGFGRRGNRLYGVPPDTPLTYWVRLVSINMQTDPASDRATLPDEQRY
jgi:FK506-binding protein 2